MLAQAEGKPGKPQMAGYVFFQHTKKNMMKIN